MSKYFIEFLYNLTNLFKQGFCSPLQESFDLNNISGGCPDGGAEPSSSVPATPSQHQRRLEKQAEKSGAQKKKADDALSFFTDISKEEGVCSFCLQVFLFIYLTMICFQ